MLKKRYPVLFAFLIFGLSHFHNDVLFNWADEGFLWLGARMTLAGLAPVLDFQSYDPGRYYWCAAVMHYFGDGLLAVRFAAELFQLLGMMLGLLALRRVIKTPLALLGAGLVAFMWMLMPFRYFDSNMTLIALFFAVRLAEDPSAKQYWAAGAFTSLAAFFGINHGFYAFLSFTLLTFYLHLKNKTVFYPKNFSAYGVGVLTGLIPFGWMCAAVPGFAASYFEKIPFSISMLMEGKTNIPYLITWPWQVNWNDAVALRLNLSGKILTYVNQMAVGIYFIFLLVFTVIGLRVAWGLKKISTAAEALFVAALCVGTGFFHAALSRADVYHVCDDVFPVWAALLALQAMSKGINYKIVSRLGLAAFIVISLSAAGLVNNVTFKIMTPIQYMVRYPVGSDNLFLKQTEAMLIEQMKRFIASHMAPEEPILLAPMMTTFYGVLGKKSPTFEMYFVMPVSEAVEDRNLRDMEDRKVKWAMISNNFAEGSKEHYLSKTHPKLWKYLVDNFVEVSDEGMPPACKKMRYKLLKRRG